MKAGLLLRLRRAATPMRYAIGVVAGLGTAVAVIGGLGASLGIGGLAGLAVVVAAVYGLGMLVQESERAELRDAAFVWVGATVDADPVKHFGVRNPRGRAAGAALPRYVRRNVADEMAEGLSDERFVIVKGDRPSGKSRLVYEALSEHPDRVVMISERAPADSEDPLIRLMRDHGGLPKSAERQVLVLRDCVSRLIAGSITADFMRGWLDDHPDFAVIATFNPADLSRIEQRGPDQLAELERLEHHARVVDVRPDLVGKELQLARQLFPVLTGEQREWLPDFMSSATALRERFGAATREGHRLGHAIVCAVVDWARAGLDRPAPDNYVRSAVANYMPHPPTGDYEEEIAWACEAVGQSARLITPKNDGYVADWIVIDRHDAEQGRVLPDHIWWQVHEEIMEGRGRRPRSEIVDDLISLGATALERGEPDVGEAILEKAGELGDGAQRERIVRATATRSEAGSPQALVSARADDNVRQRLTSVQRLVDAPAPQPGAAAPAAFSRRLVAWVYARRVARSVARVVALAFFDGIAVLLGLAAGLLTRAVLDAGVDSFVLGDVWRYLPFWVAVAFFFFALVGLYRQDAPRARLAQILLATWMLGGVGLITASAQDLQVGALPAALTGSVVVAAVAYAFRLKYDDVSRGWVRRHGLETRTLLVGSREEASVVTGALERISRPTTVVGYLTPGPLKPVDERCLGTIADLARVIPDEKVGRVVIVDRDMTRMERQRLADLCHRDGLLVEAIPTLEDIQAGSAEPVVGQSIVLMRIDPLWPGNRAFFVKRMFDLIGSAVAIVALIPVWVVVTIAVLLEGRPVIVRSLRPGLGGKIFGMYKFRTAAPGGSGPQPDPNDGGDPPPDKGRLGSFLSKRGLDELPQLLNVFVGHMSLVGPRALHLSDHARLEPEHLRRYVVRPGVTGPWMVSDRQHLSNAELTDLDVAYLRHWTIPTDLDILAKTLRLMVRGRKEFASLGTASVAEASGEP